MEPQRRLILTSLIAGCAAILLTGPCRGVGVQTSDAPAAAPASDATVNGRHPFVAGFDRFAAHGDVDAVTAGHLLATELSCTVCHADTRALLAPKRGPSLQAVGSRIRASWIREYLLHPARFKPGTTMPDILSSVPTAQQEKTADALAAFLMSLQQPFPEIKASGANPVPLEFWNKGNAQHGQQLFHQIGCVACHEPDPDYAVTAISPSPLDTLLEQLDPEELKEMGLSSAARRVRSVPLPDLSRKYTSESLTFFLLNPEHVRSSGRMPNFSLLAVDAADIAAWLLTARPSTTVITDTRLDLPDTPATANNADSAVEENSALIQHGRQLFSELNCIHCHDIVGLSPTPANPAKPVAPDLADVDLSAASSCTALPSHQPTVRRVGQPRFVLDATQSKALRASLSDSAVANELALRLLQHNCYACHERDTLGGVGRFRKPHFETVGQVDIGDEGRLPPSLTGTGSRLTTAWLNSVLAGKGHVRPFMTIRMPVFPIDTTRRLPALFEAADALQIPAAADDVFANGDHQTLVEAGRLLMDTGCVQCHSFRGESLPGTVGVDLEGATRRLRPQWLHDFLKDPGSLKQRTRMPTFFPNGKVQNTDVLHGDMELQIAAMYAYLHDLPNQPLPARIEEARARNYELTPTDRPIVLRTFMPVAGTHAVAVGFPQQVHFAFDAEHISLAQAWRGRFLDAEGTWFVRFAPPASPLGDQPVNLQTGLVVASLPDSTTPWPADAAAGDATFLGYRLDQNGVPTFLYRVGTSSISDRIEPTASGGLRRSITIQPAFTDAQGTSARLWLRPLTGHRITPHDALPTPEPAERSIRLYRNDTGLTVTFDAGAAGADEIRSIKNRAEWIVGLDTDATSACSVVLVYDWSARETSEVK